MKIPKNIIALSGAALCAAFSGCGNGENLTESPETEQEEMASSELSGAYQQIAMYIQEGFRMYHVEGEYQAYFGPIEGGVSGIWMDGSHIGLGDETDSEYFYCEIVLEGESGQWKEEIAFTYDAEADWYVFSSQYEPLFVGDSLRADRGSSFWAEWRHYYAADVLDNCVCQITIARDADIAAPIRYDSENGPLEKDLRMARPWQFEDKDNGATYHITPRAYYYWDERLDVDIDIQYPQVELEEGKEEMEEAINEKLREAFFYGYDWDEEVNLLVPGEEMYLDIERSYMITREDERYLSMRIYEYNSYRYANHPNEWETGITFDMRTGEVVRLEDVLGNDETEELTLKELLDRGNFRCLWEWEPGDKGWIEELKEELGDAQLRFFDESDFYLTDKGLGLIISLSRYYTCLEADYEDLGIEGF